MCSSLHLDLMLRSKTLGLPSRQNSSGFLSKHKSARGRQRIQSINILLFLLCLILVTVLFGILLDALKTKLTLKLKAKVWFTHVR